MAQRFSAPKSSMGRGSSNGVPRSLIVLSVISLALFVLGVREGDSGLLHGVRGVFQTGHASASWARSWRRPSRASPTSWATSADSGSLRPQGRERRPQGPGGASHRVRGRGQHLTDLLQLRNQYSLDSTAAPRHRPARPTHVELHDGIDKGHDVGHIQTGMPVMTSTGVVGQVSECGPHGHGAPHHRRVLRRLGQGQSGGAGPAPGARPTAPLHLNLIPHRPAGEHGQLRRHERPGRRYPKGLPVRNRVERHEVSGSLCL